MPASLNKVGAPKSVDLTNITDSSEVQLEAHNAYGLLKDLTARESHWIIGGDLNEIREDRDRRLAPSVSSYRIPKYKFVTSFLQETNGLDVWRECYPNTPGFTYKSSKNSLSRLDYFLASPLLDLSRTKNGDL